MSAARRHIRWSRSDPMEAMASPIAMGGRPPVIKDRLQPTSRILCVTGANETYVHKSLFLMEIVRPQR